MPRFHEPADGVVSACRDHGGSKQGLPSRGRENSRPFEEAVAHEQSKPASHVFRVGVDVRGGGDRHVAGKPRRGDRPLRDAGSSLEEAFGYEGCGRSSSCASRRTFVRTLSHCRVLSNRPVPASRSMNR